MPRPFPIVHIAGTNGKTSAAWAIARAFESLGFKVGLYASPHLLFWNERIRINGEPMPIHMLAEEMWCLHHRLASREKEEGVLPVTSFELMTLIAIRYFEKKDVDVAVVETGMGGRLDATNLFAPCVSVITRIEEDHREQLGSDLIDIASEKAGIIKAGVPTVASREQNSKVAALLADKARESGSPILFARDDYLWSSLNDVDGQNMELVRKAVDFALAEMGESPPHLPSFHPVKVPGRFQLLKWRLPVLLDGAHNPAAMKELVARFERFFSPEESCIILGCQADKDAERMLTALGGRFGRLMLTASGSPKGDAIDRLIACCRKMGFRYSMERSVSSAIASAAGRLGPGGAVLVTGSFYLIGRFMREAPRVLKK